MYRNNRIGSGQFKLIGFKFTYVAMGLPFPGQRIKIILCAFLKFTLEYGPTL
jgi:hypothetical protein